jgi:hypothetical protein
MTDMAWNRTVSSDYDTRTMRGVPSLNTPVDGANDNAQGAAVPAEHDPRWPLAVIAFGLLLSLLWCAGLLYGAYLLLDWAGAISALSEVAGASRPQPGLRALRLDHTVFGS